MTTDASRENLRLVGAILTGGAVVIAAFAVVSVLGWMPLSAPARRAAALVFAVTALVEGAVAAFFLVHYRR
jgi:hypothetical protein